MRISGPRGTLAAICIICTAIIAWLHFRQPAYASIELRARDWLMTNPLARRSPRNPQIAFLAIDEASRNLTSVFPADVTKSRPLQLMKQGFPWNREVYSHVIERLLAAGARAVVLDMLFPGPREGDEAFRTALERYRDRVALGSNLQAIEEDNGSGSGPLSLKPTHVVASPTLLPPGPPTDARLGFVNVYPDGDGLVRRTRYRTTLLEFFDKPPTDDSEELFSLAARALEKAGFESLVPRTHEPLMFRYAEEIRPRSLHEIFVEDQWNRPPYNGGELFRDKIVLVGSAGNLAEDRLQTPFGVTLGPMIHLGAINAALNRDFLHETSRSVNFALIIGGGALAWALGAWIRRPLLRLVLLITALAGYYATSQTVFNTAGFLPILLSPLVALAGSGITWSVWEQVLERVEKARLRRTFERYVSRDVVKELVDNPQSFLNTLGGVRKNITVLFSDVRGFTTMTESADAAKLVAQLNEYFTEMVRIVFKHNGTLDKFIGDAVMAHWGSIVSEGEKTDACRAVSTALHMRRALAKLNEQWKPRGLLELHFGIGINHGEAIVGNLGSEEKREVSAIGDSVNLASRLEGVTKSYHIELCIGENVESLVRDAFIVRSLDLILVKGKTKPVEVFTVLEERTNGGAGPPWLAQHEEAMRLYRAGDFFAASERWRIVVAEQSGDEIAKLFLERCAALQANPPQGEWRGVYAMTSK
jgi:adenylate cyclase